MKTKTPNSRACVAAIVFPVAVAVCWITGGCGSKQPPVKTGPSCPEWTRGGSTSGRFPAEQYLVGVGSSTRIWNMEKAEKEATSLALAKIVTQLEAKVESKIVASEWSTTRESSGVGGSSSAYGDSVKQDSQIDSSLVLEGAQAVDKCVETDDGRLYVLFVLDRQRFASITKEKALVSADQATKEFADIESERKIDAIEKIRRLGKLKQVAATAGRYAEIYIAVTASHLDISGISESDIENRLQKVKRDELRILLVSNAAESINAAVMQAVTAQGLTVVSVDNEESAASGQTLIQLEIDARHTFSPNTRIAWIDTLSVMLAVKNLAQGRIEKQVRIERKAGGPSKQDAMSRAEAGVVAEIGKEVQKILRAMLNPGKS